MSVGAGALGEGEFPVVDCHEEIRSDYHKGMTRKIRTFDRAADGTGSLDLGSSDIADMDQLILGRWSTWCCGWIEIKSLFSYLGESDGDDSVVVRSSLEKRRRALKVFIESMLN